VNAWGKHAKLSGFVAGPSDRRLRFAKQYRYGRYGP
jgi:hypothetical protein